MALFFFLFWLGVRACAWWSHSQGKVGGWATTTAAATTSGVQCHYFADWDRSIKRDMWKEGKKRKVREKGGLGSLLFAHILGHIPNHIIMEW